MKTFEVTAHWDPDAQVWWADSDAIPGLATQSESLEELDETVRSLAPELLRLNLGFEGAFQIKLLQETV